MHYDYDSLVAALGLRIKALRQERGLSQMNMVQQYGYHLSIWQSIEGGRRMSLRILTRVANTFDISLVDLLKEAERLDGPGYGSKGFTPPPGSDLGEGE